MKDSKKIGTEAVGAELDLNENQMRKPVSVGRHSADATSQITKWEVMRRETSEVIARNRESRCLATAGRLRGNRSFRERSCFPQHLSALLIFWDGNVKRMPETSNIDGAHVMASQQRIAKRMKAAV